MSFIKALKHFKNEKGEVNLLRGSYVGGRL